MRESELRKHANCSMCGKGIGHTRIPLFWRVRIERFGLDAGALTRQQGLTMMLGGSAALAAVMGADEDMAKPVMEPITITLCERCAVDEAQSVATLAALQEGG